MPPDRTDPTCPVCGAEAADRTGSWNELAVWGCEKCDHRFVAPVPDPSQLAAIYEDGYYQGSIRPTGFQDYAGLHDARIRMFGRHLDLIASRGGPGRLLDVGCANGDFLVQARQRGWEVLGVDPSAARSEAIAAGVPLVGTTVGDAEVPVRTLDVITFWDVLEHVPDPVGDLRSARRLLKPGGLVAATVPDAGNVIAKLSGRRWFGFRTTGEHLQFFSRQSLRQTMEEAGFRVISQDGVPWSCTLGFLGDRAGLYLGLPGLLLRRVLEGSWFKHRIVDVPLVNQLALCVVD
ncbi:MAG TPA: class I SAM-dependent methyltransferase [Candidatus Dormibacteraeota bacterium]|jgi:SAM-dependent methyltransferase